MLQTIGLDRGCFSCALGGEDGRTLFMIANAWGGAAAAAEGGSGQVLAARVSVRGAGWVKG